MRLKNYDGKLIIFTSFYKYQAYAPYIDSLIKTTTALDRLNVRWDYWQHTGDFHIERAVNVTLEKFIESDATDFLMIDSDESWQPEGVFRLLDCQEEVVAGVYRMTNSFDKYVGIVKEEDGHPVGRMLPDGTALLEAVRLPGGFLRIKKSALIKFKEHYPELRVREGNDVCTNFFERMKAITSDNPYPEVHSQDYAFSSRWAAIGGKMWIDPMIKINHLGIKDYEGDFDKYLRRQLELAAENKAFESVRQMAEDIKNRAA